MDRQIVRLSQARVLVVGDLILDRYWYGVTERVSPEAPVPVVQVRDVDERVGGAANVAANIAALDASTILVGRIGRDPEGETLARLCRQAGIRPEVVVDDGLPTIVKLRVVSQRQQLARIDFERVTPDNEAAILDRACHYLDEVDAVVVSDYAKGALTRAEDVIAAAREAGKPVIVDPKGRDFSRYRGASVVTPNLAEFEAVAGHCADPAAIESRGREVMNACGFDALLVTRGADGMVLVTADAPARHVAADAREVFDVTGAGDTVCGVLAAALGSGLELDEGMRLANAAAGIAVSHFGAATVTREELTRAVASRRFDIGACVSVTELNKAVTAARARGERIVMTNGCFDLLHAGHVRYLRAAAELGDRLVVAVNDDGSVARLKGASRPVNPLDARMQVLAELQCVDWVVPFAEETPRALIADVLPDVLVKGGDYRAEDVAGAEEVIAAGGEVRILDYHEGYSTTAMLERIGPVSGSGR